MWDEVLGHQQNKEFLQKLLKPGTAARMPFCFMVWAALAKKCWPCILQKRFYASLRQKSPAVFAKAAV